MDKIMIDIREESSQIQRIFKNKDLVSIEDLLYKIEELDDEKEHWEEEYKDLQDDLQENYKRISQYE